MSTRTERDSMGTMEVPADALYGAQTERARRNFPISGWTMPRRFLEALGRVKRAAAAVNGELGRLDDERVAWIREAATEVVDGSLDAHFVVDVFQTGSGTSTNMNANEVIANRAIQLAGGTVGSREPVHPNDHVNLGQSSNDVIPTALQIAVAVALHRDLLPALATLEGTLEERAQAFAGIVKLGRTHLQDATPVRLDQVLRGYAAQLRAARERLVVCLGPLGELPLGGTAVGTGINTHPEFGGRVAAVLAGETGLPLCEARDHFAAQGAADAAVATAGALKGAALALSKVANDLRLLASGPRGGIGELRLPAVQPGSSIMPGKVNPVIAESVIQVAAYVVGADAAVAHAAATLSQLELSVSLPVIAHQLLESTRLLAAATRNLDERAVRGLEADAGACAAGIEGSLAMATALAPVLGYDVAAEIAKQAYRSGRTVREVAQQRGVLPDDELERLLDPASMTEPR